LLFVAALLLANVQCHLTLSLDVGLDVRLDVFLWLSCPFGPAVTFMHRRAKRRPSS